MNAAGGGRPAPQLSNVWVRFARRVLARTFPLSHLFIYIQRESGVSTSTSCWKSCPLLSGAGPLLASPPAHSMCDGVSCISIIPICVQPDVCMYVRMRACMRVCMYVCTVCVLYVCMYVCMCVCVHGYVLVEALTPCFRYRSGINKRPNP